MERTEWIEHCEKVDRLLRQVREQGSPLFTPEEDKHFQATLAANELEVAFDLLCWKFDEAAAPISQEIYGFLADAGWRMGLPSSHWTKLKQLVR
jgi:hypothetical protein